MKAPGADPAGRLVGTMIDVLVAELAEPGRLRRGRALAQQGAVAVVDIEPGLLVADVQGSERDPYAVTVRVATVAPDTDRLASLVPHRRQLRFECTCPDDDVPCKHAVAAMAVFAQRLSYDPSLFLRWRTGAESLGGAVGGGAPSARPPGTSTAPVPVDDGPARLAPAAHAALRELLGEARPEAIPVPVLTALSGPRDAWDDIWRSMLSDALAVLRRGHLRPPPGAR